MGLASKLERSGYLGGLSGGFKRFLQNLNESEDQDEFNKLMTSAIGEIQKTYSDEEEPTFVPGTESRLGDLLPKLGTRKGVGQPGDDEVPEDMILGDVTGRRYGTITADEQRMKIQRTIAETLMKTGQLEDLDPSKITQGTQILDLFGKSVTPTTVKKSKPETKFFNFGQGIIQVDPDTGEVSFVREPTEKTKLQKSVGSYQGKNKDGVVKSFTKIFDSNTGEIIEIESDHPVRLPSRVPKKLPELKNIKADVGSLINMIYYNEDLTETTPAEQKQRREIAQNQILDSIPSLSAIGFLQTDIWSAWNRENMSKADFNAELIEGIKEGKLSLQDAKYLEEYNELRIYLYDDLIESVKTNPEE